MVTFALPLLCLHWRDPGHREVTLSSLLQWLEGEGACLVLTLLNHIKRVKDIQEVISITSSVNSLLLAWPACTCANLNSDEKEARCLTP